MAQTHDAYCWKCCGRETTLKCSKCIRSFHVECSKDENIDPTTLDSWCCYVCNAISTSTCTTQKQLDSIPTIIKRFFQLDCKKKNMKRNRKGIKVNVKVEEDRFFASDKIVKTIDLPNIMEKANKYTSLDEFLEDVQWFVHNNEILFPDNADKIKRAKKLLKLVSEEIESVKKCVECHINANTTGKRSSWFKMVCHPPHLIIWAYRKNARYWPAKLMSIDGDQINVRFFGRGFHKHENVPVNKCYLYSKESPNYYNPKSNDTDYKSALKEADDYINNIGEEYGSFERPEQKTKFNPNLYNDYMLEFISGVRKSPQNLTPQNGEGNENEMGNPSTSGLSQSSAGIVNIDWFSPTNEENDDENTTGSCDTNDNMETENGSISTDNETNLTDDDLDAESVSALQHFTNDFNRILKKRRLQVKALKEANIKLVAENDQIQNEHKEQIEVLKRAHDQELTRLKDQHQRMIEEHKQAIVEQYEATVERCKQECSQRVEDAKKNKYCMGCGNGKPLDIYICSMDCQRRCWDTEAN